MRAMKQNSKAILLSNKAYDLVYEGLWDLYCKKSQSPDLNPKKLEGFIQRIKLSIPPQDLVDDEGNVTPSAAHLPLKAIVKIRIPLKRPQENPKKEDVEDEN